MNLSDNQKKEIQKCKKDFAFFCEKYLKIVNKKGKLVSFDLNPVQKKILEEIETNHWLAILKSRQLGSSTFIAGYFFWKIYFSPNRKAAVLAHSKKSAESIFTIYRRFYEMLPEWMKFPLEKSSVNELKIKETGSMICVFTANSESARSSTFDFIHLSEAAFYDSFKKTLTAVNQTANDNAVVVIETTANGLNEYYDFWNDDNGFKKIFLSWTMDPTCSLFIPKVVPPILKSFVEHGNLSIRQKAWIVETFEKKCFGDLHALKQEHPIDPIQCFVLSGDHFFNVSFQNVAPFEGLRRYHDVCKNKIYVIGVDTASGSMSDSSDFSAFVVLDITDSEKPIIVSSFKGKLSLFPYADLVLEECKYWNNAYAVIERNSYGLTIIERLLEREYSFLWTQEKWSKIENRFSTEYGFWTSESSRGLLCARLQKFINEERVIGLSEEERLKKEVNTFVFNENEKAEAMKNEHDDILIALALALMAIDHRDYIVQNRHIEKPGNASDWVRLELELGMTKEQIISNGTFGATNRGSLLPW